MTDYVRAPHHHLMGLSTVQPPEARSSEHREESERGLRPVWNLHPVSTRTGVSSGNFRAVAFPPEGAAGVGEGPAVAVASIDPSLDVVMLDDRFRVAKVVRISTTHASDLLALDTIPQKDSGSVLLASGDADGSVVLSSPAKLRQVSTFNIAGWAYVSHLKWSSANERLFVAGHESVSSFSLSSGSGDFRQEQEFPGLARSICVPSEDDLLCPEFSKVFLTGTEDGNVRMWDVRSAHAVKSFLPVAGFPSTMLYSGNLLCVGCYGGRVECWDMRQTGRFVSSLGVHSRYLVMRIAKISEDVFVSGSQDHELVAWRRSVPKLLCSHRCPEIVNDVVALHPRKDPALAILLQERMEYIMLPGSRHLSLCLVMPMCRVRAPKWITIAQDGLSGFGKEH